MKDQTSQIKYFNCHECEGCRPGAQKEVVPRHNGMIMPVLTFIAKRQAVDREMTLCFWQGDRSN